MQLTLHSIKNHIRLLNKARRETYLDQQRRKIKYFLKDKIKEYRIRGGVWLISHSPFLKKEFKTLLNDFRDYFALKQSLIANFSSPYFIQNFNTIKEWLYSKEFKEKYQDKLHPYPSLLNPEKIDYNTIPAELAWEMNLPLKQCDMVKFESHGVGSVFSSFMKQINVAVAHAYPIANQKQSYIYYFDALNAGARILLIREYFLEGKKLHSLISTPKIRTLNQVRDPISTLKSYIIMRKPKTQKKQINLTYDAKEHISNLISYYTQTGDSGPHPNCKAIGLFIEDPYSNFHDALLYNNLININEVEFMDMSEIVGGKTFETMKKFAKEFNVLEPKEKDREFFERRLYDFNLLLPINLYVHGGDLEKINTNDDSSLEKEGGIYFHILKKFLFKNGIDKDITNEILSEDISKIDIIRVTIKCEDEEKYKELKTNIRLFGRTRVFVKELIENILEQEKIENAKKLTECDILNYLRENEKLRKKFKKVLDEKHLTLIKSKRPDIVASWKYYQEFEKMCEELDQR